jgi:hypothetical protein
MRFALAGSVHDIQLVDVDQREAGSGCHLDDGQLARRTVEEDGVDSVAQRTGYALDAALGDQRALQGSQQAVAAVSHRDELNVRVGQDAANAGVHSLCSLRGAQRALESIGCDDDFHSHSPGRG